MKNIADPNDERHGSKAGYSAHYRKKVPMCDACREWRRASDREKWRKSREGVEPGKPGRLTVVEKARTEDVDWVVVHRIVNEHRPCEANTAERLEVVRQWIDSGKSLDQLERFIGWNVRRYVDVINEHRDVVLELAERWAA